jgi:UDP-3-O-[3-hydroxymyristoyl] N-acetylglucosamine deacetylase
MRCCTLRTAAQIDVRTRRKAGTEPRAIEAGPVQHSLKTSVAFAGVGLHSGVAARMVVHPAPADHGIWFLRGDVTGPARIPAIWSAVQPSRLCTVIANADGTTVSTIEHVMAALAGCGIHNATIEIDGPEVPILDGSAEPFVRGFLRAGLVKQAAPVRAIRVVAPVEVREGEAVARLEPAEMLEIDFRIEFVDGAIGSQRKALNMSNGTFVRELSGSRTFCRQRDVDEMRARGLALGGSLHNAVVVEGDRVLSPGGLRYRDEPVRHKMLDALGDLALAGGPVLGRYTGIRAGHALTNRLLRALFADGRNWSAVDCGPVSGRALPGAGLSLSDHHPPA